MPIKLVDGHVPVLVLSRFWTRLVVGVLDGIVLTRLMSGRKMLDDADCELVASMAPWAGKKATPGPLV